MTGSCRPLSQEDASNMSSSAALKVLFALSLIWASYETSIALDEEWSGQGSSTTESEITAATTLFPDAEEQQSTTGHGDLGATDASTVGTTEEPVSDASNDENDRQEIEDSGTTTNYQRELANEPDEIRILNRWDVAYGQDVKKASIPDAETWPGQNDVENVESGITPQFSSYIYELDTAADGSLQDISGQESSIDNLYINFESMREKTTGNETEYREEQPMLQITSYLADSDSAIAMTGDQILRDARNRTLGADMISAFFIAPEDEVNEIDKTQYSGHPIVVNNLNEDLVRNERFTGKEETKTLTNDILAPIQAAVSLSQGGEGPVIEKQILHQGPVYKTFIEIQKSIPYEIKESVEPKEAELTANKELGIHTQLNDDTIYPPSNELPHSQITNELSIYTRNPVGHQPPVYYRYPMYYLPQKNVGNYITRHSHESPGYYQAPSVRPVWPIQYLVARYQPQLYNGFLLAHPYYISPSDTPDSPSHDSNAFENDQSTLQAAQSPKYVAQLPGQNPPFRPSHPMYASQYPPYTYHVMTTMRGRAGRARTARSKKLRIEYGGFKPPMVPSVQIDDEELINPAEEKTDENI